MEEEEQWGGGLGDVFSSETAAALLSGLWEDKNDRLSTLPPISDLTEQKYLTMNWWILNVGWKDLVRRVKIAVADVFDR